MPQDPTTSRNSIPIVRKVGGCNRWPKSIKYEIATQALIDERDFEFLSDRVWTLAKDLKTDYANHNLWDGKKTTKILMHAEVWKRHNGPIPPGYTTDHADRNGLNNRIENLRLADRAQQQRNQGLYVNSKTGFKGVCWVAKSRMFQAGIMWEYRSIHLGWYPTAIEAAVAYNAAAKFIHGEFAWLNPIPNASIDPKLYAAIYADSERRCKAKIIKDSQ